MVSAKICLFSFWCVRAIFVAAPRFTHIHTVFCNMMKFTIASLTVFRASAAALVRAGHERFFSNLSNLHQLRALGLVWLCAFCAGVLGAQPESAASLLAQEKGRLLFMENRGQVLDQHGRAKSDILFLAKGGGLKVGLRANGISYQFEKANAKKAAVKPQEGLSRRPGSDVGAVESVASYRLDMYLEGANPSPEVLRETSGGYEENYYNIPSAPDGITGVKSWTRIRLKEVYPGIDWVIYSQEGKMKYDFEVRPGADPSRIRMRYAGGVAMRLGENGALTVTTPLGELTEQAPVSFQDGREIPSRFVLKGGVLSLGFTGYNPSRPLVVDPALIWGTYYGGAGRDLGFATATDASGNVYLAGETWSGTGIAAGGHQNSIGAEGDAFLVKFDASGVRLWGTYYGGAGFDIGYSTAIDASGNVYLAGRTVSTTGIAAGGHQNTYGGDNDAFLVKFNASGVRLWGTYCGGTGNDWGYSTATDGNGNVYLAGQTTSSAGIAAGGYQNTFSGSNDAFLVKFNASGVWQWGTYYGGVGNDFGRSTAIDASGNVYLAGETWSATGIAAGGHQNSIGAEGDAFLVKFNGSGVWQWGTYYGGTDYDSGSSTSTDASGNVYLAGQTLSSTGIAAGGHQNTYGGNADAFLVKFNTSGVRQWGTYYGGGNGDTGYSTATDGNGNVYLTGYTGSATGIASGGHQNTFGGATYDAFFVKFNGAGLRQWGTYYGGEFDDIGYSTATDGIGNVYLAGNTLSSTGIASGGHQTTYGGSYDAFLAKFQGGSCAANDTQAPSISCPTGTITRSTDPGQCSAVVTYNNVTGSDNCALANGQPAWVSGGTGTTRGATTTTGTFAKGTTTVQWKATDQAGLTKTCTFRVIVSDTEAPSLTCPAPINVNTAPGQCGATVSYSAPTFTDNCAPTSGTAVRFSGPPSGSLLQAGVSNVVFQATDAASKTSRCTLTITVTDNQAPTITCPTPIAATGSGAFCTATVFYNTPTASDNCEGPLSPFLLSGLGSGSSYPTGATVNTWRAITYGGQTVECSFTVTVTCPSPAPRLLTGGGAGNLEGRMSRSDGDLALFPNPAKGEVRFSVEGMGGTSGELLVLDAMGRLVLRRPWVSGQQSGTFDVSEWTAGLYQVWLRTDREVAAKKLVVGD